MSHHKQPDGSEERKELLDELEENHERSRKDAAGKPVDRDADTKDKKADKKSPEADEANPPRTTTGFMTAPKFGSAGSGGAELEPGPKKN